MRKLIPILAGMLLGMSAVAQGITNIVTGTLQPFITALSGATSIQFDAMPTYDRHYWGGLIDVDVPIPGTTIATNIVGNVPWTSVGLEFGYVNRSFDYGCIAADFGPTFNVGPLTLHPYTKAGPLYAINLHSGESSSAGAMAATGCDFVIPISRNFVFRIGGRIMTFSNNPKPVFAIPVGFNWAW